MATSVCWYMFERFVAVSRRACARLRSRSLTLLSNSSFSMLRSLSSMPQECTFSLKSCRKASRTWRLKSARSVPKGSMVSGSCLGALPFLSILMLRGCAGIEGAISSMEALRKSDVRVASAPRLMAPWMSCTAMNARRGSCTR
eukprot:Mycagemm_TRINITY_DN10183_c0_g1::TRINITY_DN10183_c0_g1_i1::g.4997::m.4997 type:complete len:143 gc:universal TRINITY_DN10183_c0_g1_i1:1221-793(-)